MDFLFVTTSLPNLAKNGGEIATLNFVEALKEAGHRCDVAGYARLDNPPPTEPGFHSARTWPIETQTAGMMPYWWMTKALATGQPFSVVKFISANMRDLVLRLARDNHYDAMIVDHANMYWIMDEPGLPETKILIAHNVECELYRDMACIANPGPRRLAHEREARALRQAEQLAARRAAQVWTLSQHDADWFKTQTGQPAVYPFDVPGKIQSGAVSLAQRQYPVGLLGSWSWQANHIGLAWFLAEVAPHIDPSVDIYVAGAGADPRLCALPNVHMIGFQKSAQAFFRGCNCLVIPSTSGGGVQIKTIEAISAGIPTVTTTFALRGLSQVPDFVHCTDDPREMAARISALAKREPDPADGLKGHQWLTQRKQDFARRLDDAVTKLAQIRAGKTRPQVIA